MTKFSSYTLDTLIYEGINSGFFLAHRIKDKVPAFIKIAHEVSGESSKLIRLRREYQLLKKIHIDGVTQPIDFIDLGKSAGIVFEDHEEKILTEICAGNPLDMGLFLSFASKISEILGKLHQAGIIHKDIKPDNILFNPKSGLVELFDFGIASEISREFQQEFRQVDLLEGTLAYMSPEQTGRVNRPVDYRTDFYSLGITFYQLVTGKLPFEAGDSMEMVHCHIAKEPIPPIVVNPSVPEMVSKIIMKLLSKSADERYQSAYGLRYDLTKCLEDWEANHKVSPFSLGTHDIPSKFQVSQKLYGRDEAIATLTESFSNILTGRLAMIMVTGSSGIGKTSLVNEVHRSLATHKGSFISGKCDQLKRNSPYHALSQALNNLAEYIFVLPKDDVEFWKKKILDAVGKNAQLIINLSPSWELILGKQPPLESVTGDREQARFKYTFKQFIEEFCTADHPLVIFLDDLQWVDSASLALIEDWLNPILTKHLLFIGAYRSNEVTASHPLSVTINEVKKRTPVSEIFLQPLSLRDVELLTRDTLYCKEEDAAPLANQVYRKTEGNPFFINELLQQYYHDRNINFNDQTGTWQWDLVAIRASKIADNVLAFMTDRLTRVPDKTQNLLKYAAILGVRFSLERLCWLTGLSPAQSADELWPAIQNALIQPLTENYRLISFDVADALDIGNVLYQFSHDQVQQAAKEMLSTDEEPAVHLKLAKTFLSHCTQQQVEDELISIVQHYNEGIALVKDANERDKLLDLNLRAGKKAKEALAYEVALQFANQGIEMLPKKPWQNAYHPCYALHMLKMESLYRTNQFDEGEKTADLMLYTITNVMDKAQVYFAQQYQYVCAKKWRGAKEKGDLGILALGYPWKPKPNYLHILWELLKFRFSYKKFDVQKAVKTGPILDEPALMLLRRLMTYTSMFMTVLNDEKMQLYNFGRVSNEYLYSGFTKEDILGIPTLLISLVFNDFDRSLQWSEAAFLWQERANGNRNFHLEQFFACYFIRWRHNPWKELSSSWKLAAQTAAQAGDLLMGTLGRFFSAETASEFGSIEELLDTGDVQFEQAKQAGVLGPSLIIMQGILFKKNIGGDPVPNPVETIEDDFSDSALIGYSKEGIEVCLVNHFIYKVTLAFAYEDYEAGFQNLKALKKYEAMMTGSYHQAIFYAHVACALGGIYDHFSDRRRWAKRQFRKYLRFFKNLAHHYPDNFLACQYLIEAELARIKGDHVFAIARYEQALKKADEMDIPQFLGLLYENVFRYYRNQGADNAAAMYLQKAHAAYRRWGAKRKVGFLEQRYPEFLQLSVVKEAEHKRQETVTETLTETIIPEGLDLSTVLKSSQTISQEIDLNQLIAKMLRILVENVGAETGSLFLMKKDELTLEGSYDSKKEQESKIGLSSPIHPEHFPVQILHFVHRKHEQLVIDDAAKDARFQEDPYIATNQPKSILCTPIELKDHYIGILYFENNLSSNAFTKERVETLAVLSTQVAISIENARLYTSFERFVPKAFLHQLGERTMIDIELGDQVQKQIVIMMSDIREFTHLAEKMSSAETFQFINEYLAVMEPIIARYNGFIDKYIGDAIMALFPANVDDALLCAFEMQEACQNFKSSIPTVGAVEIGIALNRGEIILGIVGGARRFEGTVIGDAVNTASRIEALNSRYRTKLLIGDSVYQNLHNPNQFWFRIVDKVLVKGKTMPTYMYEVLGSKLKQFPEQKKQMLELYSRAWTAYESGDFGAAKDLLLQSLQIQPEDHVSELLLQRCERFLQEGRPENWDGTTTLFEKY